MSSTYLSLITVYYTTIIARFILQLHGTIYRLSFIDSRAVRILAATLSRSPGLSGAINLKYRLDKSKLHIATRRASASHRGTSLSTRNEGKKGIPVPRRGGPNRHV